MKSLAVALIISLPGTVVAQEVVPMPAETLSFYQPAQTKEWTSVASGLSKAELVERLSAEGWRADRLDALKLAEKFDLYSQPVAPGVTKYLVSPENLKGQLLELSPAQASAVPAFIPRGLWLDIGERVRNLACKQNFRPATVTAFGDLGDTGPIELVWDTESLCEGFVSE